MESMRIILASVALLALATPAAAQEAGASEPLKLTVRPSGQDTTPDEAVARQERLLKRMAQNDFLFRSICERCGDAWKHNSYAPFNPMRSLRGMAEETSPEEAVPAATIPQP